MIFTGLKDVLAVVFSLAVTPSSIAGFARFRTVVALSF
jgi:hypothetical protein